MDGGKFRYKSGRETPAARSRSSPQIREIPIVILYLIIILGKIPEWRFCLLTWPLSVVVRRRSFVHHKVSGSCNERTVWHRITKVYLSIHIDLTYSLTGYDVTRHIMSAANWISILARITKIVHKATQFANWQTEIGGVGGITPY